MFAFLIVLIALVAFFIITIVLLQSGKGGGLAAEFGGASSSTDSIMGGRQAANFLTRASGRRRIHWRWSWPASRSTAPQSSILRQEFQTPSGGPESVLESEGEAPAPVLDEAGDPAAGEAEPEGDE